LADLLFLTFLGLANRLRALTSALTISRKTGRHLRTIWPVDHHCQARFQDLFESDNFDLYSSVTKDEIKSPRIDMYNYMEPEKGAKVVPIIYYHARKQKY
jgi:hypothetical protein